MLISFPNELAKQINPASFHSAKSIEISFAFCAPAQIGNCFFFLVCKPKKKKHLSLIRENPHLLLYRCIPCPQRKILFLAM